MTRRTRIGKFALSCALMNATAALAVPITFEFTALGLGPAYSGPAGTPFLAVPAPFADFDWTWEAPISGSITLESDVVGQRSFAIINGERIEAGLTYVSPVSQLTLDIRERHFEFTRTVPPGVSAPSPGESFIGVSDLSPGDNAPPGLRDGVLTSVQMGTGVLEDPFSHLAVIFSMSVFTQDRGIITSPDMIENFSFMPGWTMSLSFLDRQTSAGYSLRGNVTSIERVSVPEPGSLSLIAAGLGLMFAIRRRRASLASRHDAVTAPA